MKLIAFLVFVMLALCQLYGMAYASPQQHGGGHGGNGGHGGHGGRDQGHQGHRQEGHEEHQHGKLERIIDIF